METITACLVGAPVELELEKSDASRAVSSMLEREVAVAIAPTLEVPSTFGVVSAVAGGDLEIDDVIGLYCSLANFVDSSDERLSYFRFSALDIVLVLSDIFIHRC